ncbi:calcium-binding protein [Pararhizobium arenae]|uniref:calcium-binding protein n=1 Tax=Pararhizobium arenae TaxID=1856850 RepID=UPI000AC6CB13|nr:calcium-binding protein [Pararhizobium arenae]
MATINFSDITGGVDMSLLEVSSFLEYDHAQWSRTQLKLYDDSKNYSLFTGTGLTYKVQSGEITAVTGGTVTGLKVVFNNVSVFSVTGWKVSAKSVGDAIFKDQSAVFLSLLLSGNDTVNGTKHDDALLGGVGTDTLNGGAGDDLLEGGVGADKLVGGSGSDTGSYFFAKAGVTASLAKPSANTGDAKGDTYSSIENLLGTQYADKIYGNGSSNALVGAAGNDLLDGGAGNDLLVGGLGADRLFGGSGFDTALYDNSAKAVTVNLAKPSLNTNEAAGDTYSSIEAVSGSRFADKLYGNSSANTLEGNLGADLLNGAAGDDKLYGGSGADDLYGGTGKDTFIYASFLESTVSTTNRDTIFDFSGAAGDKIDLSDMDASTKAAGNQAFSFIETRAFSGKAGELRYEKKASDTYIYGDLDGNKKADFAIHLDDAVTMLKGYFIL